MEVSDHSKSWPIGLGIWQGSPPQSVQANKLYHHGEKKRTVFLYVVRKEKKGSQNFPQVP